MVLSMKRVVTLFITLLSCTMASLQAMETAPTSNLVPSLQEMALRKQLDQWEEKLHNALDTTKRIEISAEIKDFFETRPALEELSKASTPSKIAEPINNGNAWIRGIAHQRYELELNVGRTKRVFRVHAPMSQSISWNSTQSLSLSPDNRYLAIAILSIAAPGPQYGIDILEITQAGLVPCGHIPLDTQFHSYCRVAWTEQGIVIGNNQRLAICKWPLLAASNHAVQTPQWIELVGWKKFARNTWPILKTPCEIAGICIMALGITMVADQALNALHFCLSRLQTQPIPIGN